MNLYVSTYLLAAFCAVAGFPFLLAPDAVKNSAFGFLRSKSTAYILCGASIAWFTWVLFNLGEADFGNIKHWLILIFAGAGLLSFKFVPDFLPVRGLAVLGLLISREFLDSAYMAEPQSRLVLVSLTYVFVVACLYFGTVPYRARDLLEYLYKKPLAARLFGAFLVLCATALIAATAAY